MNERKLLKLERFLTIKKIFDKNEIYSFKII